MGSAVSTTSAVISMPFPLSRKVPKPNAHKVPLHVAVMAAVVVQRYVRGFQARRLLGRLRHQQKQTELAAAEYLNNVHIHRVKADRNSDHGLLRRSWLDAKDPHHHRGLGSFSSQAGHFLSDASGTMRLRESFIHHRNQNPSQGEDRGRAGGIDYSTLEDELVYPFIGFVIKAKLELSGRKVFINLCHSPRVLRAAASPMRLWTEEKRHDDDGELIVEEVLVLDVVMPSSDFNDHFVYKDGVGLVPLNPHVRDQLGDLCVMMINSMDHCPDSAQPPLASLPSVEDYRLSPHTNWPRIKRGYLGCLFPMVYEPSEPSLQYCLPFRLNKDPCPVSTQVMAAMCPPEIRAWMSVSLTAVDEKEIAGLSAIARVGQVPRGWKTASPPGAESGEGRGAEGEEDLESHHKAYIHQLRRIKEGVRVFAVLYHGILSLYAASSSSSSSEESCLSLSFPYGARELIRLVLSSLDMDTSVDLAHDLYMLHLDFLSEERESLFVLSKCLNMVATTAMDPRKLSLQFRHYSELLTWKMLFEQHCAYAQYAMAKGSVLGPAVKFHGVSLATMPSSKTTWLVERLGPRRRKRIFVKVDRGWFLVFPNDNSITPSLTHALEIFSLATVRCEVAHKRVIRMRKWMTRITLYDDENGLKREFFLRSNEGELDVEVKAVVSALACNITYAHSQFYRYVLPWLDDNEVLGDVAAVSPATPSPASSSSSTTTAPSSSSSTALLSPSARSTILNCVGCTLEVQILTPEPQTSDDDSDVDADPDADDATLGAVFRVLRAKLPTPSGPSSSSTSSSSSYASSGGLSAARHRAASSASLTECLSRYQLAGEKLREEYPAFVPGYFPCRVLLYQELHTLLFLHLNRLVAVLHVGRCVEKPRPSRRAKRTAAHGAGAAGSHKRAVDASLYSIASSDEDDDENSDRDYFEDLRLPGEDPAAPHAWVIQLNGCDGRIYRLKFSNITEFDDWSKMLQARCVTPSSSAAGAAAGPGGSDKASPRPAKLARSESFKGNHSFEFLKECALSPPELVSSPSSHSVLSLAGGPSGPPSSLLSSMLSGVGKSSFSLNAAAASRAEDKAWEASVDSDATKKFNRSLRVSEKVFAAGVVLKHEKTVSHASAAAAPKQKRVLLVTDVPRLLFIDTIGNIARGNIELGGESRAEARELEGGDFEVLVAGHTHRFTPQDSPEKDAKFWVRVIKYAVSTR